MTDKLAGRAVLGLLLILVLAVPAYARIDCHPCDAQPARVLPPTPTETATAAPTMELAPKAIGPTTWESLPPTAQQEPPPTAQPPADYPPPEATTLPHGYPTSRYFQDTPTPYPSLAPDERATLQAGPTPTPPLPEG